MTYGDGINKQHLWRSMDEPPWTGTCAKFQQGRLLMQRYKYVANYAQTTKHYKHKTERMRENARILAGRMFEHAKECQICLRERRLDDENFYGVYK
jgi:hypothetical protein